MTRNYPKLTFTPSVKAVQEEYGTRLQAARLEAQAFDDGRLTDREADFIAQRDGFYMASAGEDGWPYVQFRGGPAGFLAVIDDRTLGYADFRGNLQYISMGNFKHDDRVALILMDYANRQRLKIMARAEVFDVRKHPDMAEKLQVPDYKAKVERAVLFRIEAFDWNCPQHITPRYTEAEFAAREGGTSAL